MTSNGKQFTVTREMLTAVAHVIRGGVMLSLESQRDFQILLLFCFAISDPLGNSGFCFPRISMFPSTSSRETLRFSGNKIHCSPRDQSFSVNCPICYILFSYKLVLMFFLSELFHLLYRLFCPCIIYYKCVLFKL